MAMLWFKIFLGLKVFKPDFYFPLSLSDCGNEYYKKENKIKLV